jgi:Protein of unknown function (DUF2911)
MRMLASWCILIVASAMSTLSQDAQTAYCNFDDGNQISIRYNPIVREQPRNGRVWSPDITLFVQTPVTLDHSEIGLGAYSVHVIPDKKNWTLIVNKNVKAGDAYEPSQDVARSSMEIGEIPEATKNLQLSFAHMSAKDCSLRIYYQKTGAFAEFLEK